MLRDMIEYIPYYMKDFEEIKAICDSAGKYMAICKTYAKNMRKEFWLDGLWGRWEDLIPTAKDKTDKDDFCRAWLNSPRVFTLEVLNEYIQAFTVTDFSVEYDDETMKVTLKPRSAHFPDEEECKMIRNLIPMNMDFEVVWAEE